MRIAVLSGKGGTCKTTVAASLAMVIPGSQYIDCDVEEPNGFLFLKPEISESSDVTVLVPEVDPDLCTLCGACGRICQFSAIAVTKQRVLVFPELCHHCGACSLVCKPLAINEVERKIGVIENDAAHRFFQGRLTIGEPVGVPIISELKKRINPNRTSILDCSPGASCAVVKSLEGCDYALLVTEPTPSGRHDLERILSVAEHFKIPAYVCINKYDLNMMETKAIQTVCRQMGVQVIGQIPFEPAVVKALQQGMTPVEAGLRDIVKEIAAMWRLLAKGAG